MNRTAAEQALLEVRAAMEAQSTRLTEMVVVLRGLSLNEVLRSELLILDDTGIAERNTSVAYASVGVWALDGDVTVTSSARAAAAPASGIGVIPVPAAAAIVWPLTGTTLTVYGTAGDRVLVTLWSKPQCPMVAGIGGPVNGGGA